MHQHIKESVWEQIPATGRWRWYVQLNSSEIPMSGVAVMGDSERECAEKMVDHFLTMVCSSHRLRKES